MSTQANLLPPKNPSGFDRPLIAFAFLAQATQVQGDLMSGLTPIFKPIVKQRVGQKFDANDFTKAVGKLYGIKIHPWAVDELARRLERAGLLKRTPLAGGVETYVYGNVEETFDEVTESDIRQVVQAFIDFARPLLARLGAPVDEKALEDGFFDELTSIDFQSIVLKPEAKDLKPSTLSVPKGPEERAHHEELTARSHLDVLAAGFIVEAFHRNKQLYDLIARIATGALLAQVVLNVQDPGTTASLASLRLVLDAPFVMSVLDLSSEESFKYASELKVALVEHGATIDVFRHSLEEIADNLRGVIGGVAVGMGFGATARRLHLPAFRAYVGGVLQDLEGAVTRAGIRVVDTPKTDASYRHFTEEDENYFYGMLGSFWNPLAQQRDAASIAAIMRLRQGRRTRMSVFHQAHSVFVTQNPRVAECSARMVAARKLGSPNEVPPAITDRFLAGLIWILYGGKAAELTRYRLLASCTAALEARSDVMNKVHRFLSGVDETRAKQFRAMMTDERAGQHLMQLTLGDSGLITSTMDAEHILEQLDETFEAKHKASAERAISEAQEAAQGLVGAAEAAREHQAELARQASLGEMSARGELAESERERGKLEERLRAERDARVDEVRPLIQRSVDEARAAERRRVALVALGVGLLTFLAAFLGTEFMTSLDQRFSIGGAVVAGLIAVATFWNYPQILFGRLVERARLQRFSEMVAEYQIGAYVPLYSVDWSTGAIERIRDGSGESVRRQRG
jgi:hypothetical protein